MRKFLVVLIFVVLSACGGETAEEPTATTAATSASDTEASGEAVALPPLVSVPVSNLGADHVNPPVSFETSPSTGGDHYQFWQNCGFYTEQAIEGAATHTLEHGAVWITYNEATMSDADLTLLEEMSLANGKLLISPYGHEDAIVLSAWGVQQRGVAAPTDDVGKATIDEFIQTWQDNPELPEAGVRCNGAVGIAPDDVRSFEDGQQVPEEFG